MAAGAIMIALAPAPISASTARVEPLLPITRFSVGEGLPSALVYKLVQDASGRIWILNRAGIVSYDGAAFEAQGVQQGMIATQCGGLALDEEGRPLAAAFDARIFRREGGTWRLLAPAIGGSFSGQVVSLAEAVQDGQQAYLVGTTDGVWLWSKGSWRRLNGDANRRLQSDVTAIDRLGQDLMVGGESGLCRVRRGALDCAFGEDPRLREPILALQPALVGGRPSLLLLSRRWLGVLTDNRLRTLGRPLPAQFSTQSDRRVGPRHETASINADPTGAIFFGTQYRAYLLEPGESEARELGSAQGLLGEGANSILADREGAIWIGNLRGLNRVGSRRFLSLDARSGLAESEVTAIAEVPGKRLLLGHNAALTFLDLDLARAEPFEFRSLPHQLPAGIPRVLDLAVDPSGTAWAAAAVALLEIGRDRRIVTHLFPGRVLSVTVDGKGRLWVLRNGALHVRLGRRFEEVPFGIVKSDPTIASRRLWTDGGDRLFVATSGGLLWRDGMSRPELDANTPWSRARSVDQRGDNVYAVSTAADGTTLVGTAGGLYRLVGTSLERTSGAMALERPIYFLLRDRSSKLWAGTDDGVFTAEPGGFRQLTVRHGLAGRETNRGAGVVDSSGRVWVGTDQGLSIYRAGLDLRQSVPPAVEIDGIDLEGERRPVGGPLDLTGSPRSLVFHARTITFSGEEQVVCRYRLEGLDEEWQGPAPITATGVRYTHLPPGRYRLKIAAGWGAAGPWGPESVSPDIFIPTPWWLSPGVWTALLLLLGAALWSGHHLRLRGLGRRNSELESLNARLRESVAERQRLISELERKNIELEGFTYTVSHDLKAPLVTIRGFANLVEQDAAEGRTDQVRADIQRVSRAAETMGLLLNQLLDLSRIGRVVGPSEALPLAPLVLEASERVPHIESAQLVVPPDLPTVFGDRTRLLEVFENLLGNALKFSRSQAAPRIEVSVREGPEPVIVVADNGAGVDPRFQGKIFGLFERLDKSVEGTGIGLAIVKRVVESYGGRIWVESSGVPGEGSRFCFTLPRAALGQQGNDSGPGRVG